MAQKYNQTSSLNASSLNQSVKEASKINQTTKTSSINFRGNILKTQVEGQNDYPQYLQGVMDRNILYTETNGGSTDDIIRSRLNFYKDWRAILRISSLLNPNYAERSYSMLGRSGTRTNDQEAIKISKDETDAGAGFLSVLTEVGGILFPYTPTINVSSKVNWQKQSLVHSNINYYSWENSEPESYDISGDFTVANPSEALYCLAVLNFLRTITKGSGPNYNRITNGRNRVEDDKSLGRYSIGGMAREIPGAPPPTLYFSAYGDAMINDVPVIIDSYSYTLANDVDYVEIVLDPKNYWAPVLDSDVVNRTQNYFPNNEGYVISRVPTKFNLSLKLLTNINPTKYRQFSLWDYKNGEYLRQNNKAGYKFPSGWTW